MATSAEFDLHFGFEDSSEVQLFCVWHGEGFGWGLLQDLRLRSLLYFCCLLKLLCKSIFML